MEKKSILIFMGEYFRLKELETTIGEDNKKDVWTIGQPLLEILWEEKFGANERCNVADFLYQLPKEIDKDEFCLRLIKYLTREKLKGVNSNTTIWWDIIEKSKWIAEEVLDEIWMDEICWTEGEYVIEL